MLVSICVGLIMVDSVWIRLFMFVVLVVVLVWYLEGCGYRFCVGVGKSG